MQLPRQNTSYKFQTLAEIEREHIFKAIATHQYHTAVALAKVLGISRATFYNKLKAYGLKCETRRTRRARANDN